MYICTGSYTYVCIFTISGIIRKTSYTLICYVLCIYLVVHLKWSEANDEQQTYILSACFSPHRIVIHKYMLYFSFSYIRVRRHEQHSTVILKLCSIYEHIHIWPKQNHLIQKHSSFIFTAPRCTSHNKSHTLNAFISNASGTYVYIKYRLYYFLLYTVSILHFSYMIWLLKHWNASVINIEMHNTVCWNLI